MFYILYSLFIHINYITRKYQGCKTLGCNCYRALVQGFCRSDKYFISILCLEIFDIYFPNIDE